MSNIYLEKIAGMAGMAGKAKNMAKGFGRAFSGADVKEADTALKNIHPGRIHQRMAVMKLRKEDARKMYAARGAVGAAAAGAAGTAVAAMNGKKD